MSAAAVVHLIKSIIEPRFGYDVFGFEADIWSYRIYAVLQIFIFVKTYLKIKEE